MLVKQPRKVQRPSRLLRKTIITKLLSKAVEKSIRPNFFPSIFGKRSNPAKGKTTRGNSNVLLDAEKSAGNLDSSYGLDAQTGENEINRDFVNNDLVLAVVYESGVGLGYRQRNFAVA